MCFPIQIGGGGSSEGSAVGQESLSPLSPSPLHPSPPPLLRPLHHTRTQTEEKRAESARVFSLEEQRSPSDLQAGHPLVAAKGESGKRLRAGRDPEVGEPEVPEHADDLPLQDVHKPGHPLAAPPDQPVLADLQWLLHRLLHRPHRTGRCLRRALPSHRRGGGEYDDCFTSSWRWIGSTPGQQKALLLGKAGTTSQASKVCAFPWPSSQCEGGAP